MQLAGEAIGEEWERLNSVNFLRVAVLPNVNATLHRFFLKLLAHHSEL